MTKEIKIHFFYILTILLVIIIGLVAVNWIVIPELVKLIDFSATIASLILAVLAIVYAFYTNATNTNNATQINNASNTISSSSETLAQLTSDLKTKVESLHPLIKNMDEKTSQTNDLLNNILLNENAKKEKQGEEDNSYVKEKDPSFDFNYFVKRESISGLFILYGLKMAYIKKKIFNYVKFSEEISDITDENYILGHIVCLSALNVCEYERQDDNFTIIGMPNELLTMDFEEEIFSSVKEEGESLKDFDASKYILKIKEFFA